MLDRPDFGGVFRFIRRVMRGRPSRKLAAVFLSLAGLYAASLGGPRLAFAMHETDHRFTVSGYVYDKQGKPVGDARVHVRDLRDQKIEPVTTYTDGSGYYKAVLHLHNDNAGDPVQVTAIEEKLGLQEAKTVRAEFSPNDLKTERQATLHIGAVPEGLVPEVPMYWQYVIGGTMAGAMIGAILWWRRRKTKTRAKRRGKKGAKA
jgi:hypothetical protein